MIRCMLAISLLLLASCSVLTSPDRDYSSNRRVLSAIEKKIHYEVDPKAYRLTHVEVGDDAITLHYLGVRHPGDQVWVMRFSEKSTELAPERLATVAPAIAVIEGEGLQPGFTASSANTVELLGIPLEAATYTFESTIAPSGRVGRGIVAAIRHDEWGKSVVYQIKLDNHGDRESLGYRDLAPLIAPLSR